MIRVGVVCHANLELADVEDLRRFHGGAGLVVEGDGIALTRAVQVLFRAGVPVRWWRFASHPAELLGWPQRFVQICSLAVFAGSPDVERLPSWYAQAMQRWQSAGGHVAEPAWRNETNRLLGFRGEPYGGKPWRYNVVTARCKSGSFLNLASAAMRARQNGQRVILTDYSRPGEQQRCLLDLAQGSVNVETYLWAYRPPVDTGCQLAGLELTKPDEYAPWRRG